MARLAERDGLVERRADPDDARATRVFLTRRGRSLKPHAAQVVAKLEGRVEDRLGPRVTAALRRALAELADL